MLDQKLIKIRALREGLRFFAIYSSKMISRDLHGTFYINTHSISKRIQMKLMLQRSQEVPWLAPKKENNK